MSVISKATVLLLLLLGNIVYTQAAEVQVPPPSSAKKDNATLNVIDGINTLRAGGYGREADQMQKLLNDGNIYYRTTGPNKNDAQFVHPLIIGSDKLFLSVTSVKFVNGRTERFDSSNHRYLYLLVQTAMHEMIHKDQGAASIIMSGNRSGARGYALHEIEAYRGSYKKYAKKWVIADINAYLQKKDRMTDLQNKEAISLLRDKLFPLKNSLAGFTTSPNGDKACRWQAIGKEVVALDNYLVAMLLDHGSKYSCHGNLTAIGLNKQVAIETDLKCKGLNKLISAKDKEIRELVKKIRERSSKRNIALKKMKRTRKQSVRLTLAAELSEHNRALITLRNQLRDARRDKSSNSSTLRDIKNKNSRSLITYKNSTSNYDQCRKDYVNKRVKDHKLTADQLPLDMVMTATGQLEIVSKDDERKMNLKKSIDALQDMFGYSTKLTGALSSLGSGDPRTPCYAGNKTGVPIKLASTRPKDIKKDKDKTKSARAAETTDTWLQFRNNTVVLRYSESRVLTKTKTIVARKKPCKRGGIIGVLNCDVTARIAGEDRDTTTTTTIIVKDKRGRPMKKTYRAKIIITLSPAVMRVSEGCVDTYQTRIDVLSIKKQIPKELADKNLAAEADAYAEKLKEWYKVLNITQIRQLRRTKSLQVNMGAVNGALKTLKGAPGRFVFRR